MKLKEWDGGIENDEAVLVRTRKGCLVVVSNIKVEGVLCNCCLSEHDVDDADIVRIINMANMTFREFE